MIVKIVTLFLIGIAVLAMFGKLRLRLPRPGARPRLGGGQTCPRCGRHRIGRDAACACGHTFKNGT